MTEMFLGIFPALFSFFAPGGGLNERAFSQVMEMDISRGVSGFYVGGSTGEAFLMSEEERMEEMRICSGIAGKRVKLIAQVGDISEDKACRLAKYAAQCGYDAVSAVTPFYYKFSFEGILNYYRNISEASGLPVVIYYIPALSGANFSNEQICRLIELEGVCGIKFSHKDLFVLERLKNRYPDKSLLFGVNEMLSAGIIAGADGAIGSTYNYIPEKAVAIYNAVRQSSVPEARRLQSEANELIAALIDIGIYEGSKELLTLMGVDAGACRRPFVELNDEKREMVKKLLPLVKPL